MKKRTLSLLLVLLLACSLFPTGAFAALPKGWWPLWEAYDKAVESGADDATLLEKGDAVINFYKNYERSDEIANQLFVIYRDRLNRLIFENRSDWDKAIANTKALQEICNYQISIGNSPDTYREWLPTCAAHLAVLEPFTGVYAASYTQSKTYGSKIAAPSGAYYGTIQEGSYGESSICSFYVELERETAKQFDYLIAPRADGKRVIQINLNFENEGATVKAIPSGAYDGNIRETLEYLATLQGPVLLRIGGEMDLWSEAGEFKTAYNHIASMARSIAPRVELVWSPNYAPSWGRNVADYYPGDSVVDWVGVSLYYDYAASFPNPKQWDIEFFGFQQYSDPVRNAQTVFEIAKAHNKPAIATEGGAHHGNGEAYVTEKAAKEFSTLTMVYPQVKAIVYFDKMHKEKDYRLNGGIKAAVDAAIANNPSLIAHGESSAATFVPIDTLNEKMSGTLVLGATGRTYHSMDMSAVWSLDGKETRTSGSPNQLRVDLGALSAGKHKLTVTLSDGKGYTAPAKTYTLNYDGSAVKITAGYEEAAPQPQPAKPKVQPTNQKLAVNGSAKNTEIYNIDGSNYFKLRDIAALLNGTGSQFSVAYDPAAKMISIKTGEAYASVGGELATGTDKSASAVQSAQSVQINGQKAALTAFNIGGNNFFKLRDLGAALNFDVDYDKDTATMLVTSR